MADIRRSQCCQIAEIEHSEVLYMKIARLTKSMRFALVAGLILKKIEAKTELAYERVGRVLMTEKSARFTDKVENVILWPKQTLTII
jgi:alkylated DNA nucleotide flippase Atl1